jgi:hypothetical protein
MSLYANKRLLLAEQFLEDVLESGKMLSIEDIDLYIARREWSERLDEPTERHPTYEPDDIPDAILWNKFMDAIEVDLRVMRITLDEIWDRLRVIVEKSSQFIILEQEAKSVGRRCNNILMTVPDADSYRVSSNISLADISGIDTTLSDDVIVIPEIGSIILSRNGSRVHTIDPIGISYQIIDQSGSNRTPQVFGEIGWICNSDISKRFIADLETTDQYGPMTMTITIPVANNAMEAIVLTTIELHSSGISDHRVRVDTTYDNENWEQFGDVWGNHRFVISGPTLRATKIRIRIEKYKADGDRGNGSFTHAFDIGQVLICEDSYSTLGNFVSQSIPVPNSTTNLVLLDANVSKTDSQDVNFYIANDVVGATELGDFTWLPVSTGVEKTIAVRSLKTTSIKADVVTKMTSGAGNAYDLWAIGKIDGTLVGLAAGVDQLEIKEATVDWNTKTSMDPDDFNEVSSVSYVGMGSFTMIGQNYYRIRSVVHTDTKMSIVANVTISSDHTEWNVFVNGSDITSQCSDGKLGIGLNPGINTVDVMVKSIYEDGWYSFTGLLQFPDECDVALIKPMVVAESAITSANNFCTQRGQVVMTNFNPTGMNIHVVEATSEMSSTPSLRVRAMLSQSDGGTPVVRNIGITMGV